MKIGVSNSADVKKCLSNLTAFLRKCDEIQTVDLDTLAAQVQARAKQLAPYKTGRLESGTYARRSDNKRKPGIVAGAVAMSAGYNYAPIQHENTEFNHPIKGEARFVAKALEEFIPQYISNAQRKLSRYRE